MGNFIKRVESKLSRIWFSIWQRQKFKRLGRNAYFFSPYRVDGKSAIELGISTVFQRGAWLYCASHNNSDARISIGEGCVFGYNNHITAVGRLSIGNNVLTANNVYISDNLHEYEDVTRPIMQQAVRFKGTVEIGDGCWIGENACIIGVRIGKNCVVGANAVVTKDVPDYSVVAGIPAKVIRHYDTASGKWIR
jgi:acetyltransferase-like isoleucine patch superfamily enzyme